MWINELSKAEETHEYYFWTEMISANPEFLQLWQLGLLI